ncbi:glyoxal oxidase N-terminus-domain-containing protein [Phyllosticta capitalensis]|uniref:Glyoxal oxidase N-terminus-domain-containing protein n=1 Tax=Phyllosticta capitalensis TaxID=121624 RepID=A0ABR1YWD3_9PEZI
MLTNFYIGALLSVAVNHAAAAGFRTVGSSGCTAQMVFLQPFTDNAIFLDNYHPNYGGPGVNLQTGAHAKEEYVYDGTKTSVLSTEFNWRTAALRKLRPKSNTFCSAGAFFPDGTLMNLAGAEPNAKDGIGDGFDAIRRFAPGPCDGGQCTTDWVEGASKLQARRWYPTAEALANGDIVVVGGSNKGGLVVNEVDINVPTYELVTQTGAPPAPVKLPVLEFTDNADTNKAYNLYPILALLPNEANADEVFTLAGDQAVIWNYKTDKLVKTLPNAPKWARNFPSSATAVLLPLSPANNYAPTILLCGGSSGDKPAPKTLDDCYHIQPYAAQPAWEQVDNLPNGGQVMTDAILLPDGKVLLINGAHTGSAGGFMADDPVTVPLIYDPSQPVGSRFTPLPKATIPRMYHSISQPLPNGEVLIAGSNPSVVYNAGGKVFGNWPNFNNNGKRSFLQQQQRKDSSYPTEYRVEIFSPDYVASKNRPKITRAPNEIAYGKTFDVATNAQGQNVVVRLMAPGFHTHAVSMQHRLVELEIKPGAGQGEFTVTAPPRSTVIQAGPLLLFVVVDGIPSEGVWVKLA